ncbi:MAG: acetylxylan esterase [Candidatus Latescibacterota bacterium]|nr:acetylxylan esterase [Candidatus Latescibacterota bacterium]
MFKANYDESLVPEYILPDPLVSNDGSPVSTPAEWRDKRRAEVLALFETYVYGKTPERVIDTRVVTLAEADSCGGKAKRKEVRIYFTEDDSRPYLDLLVYIPEATEGPAPGFIGLNFQGNHSVTEESDVIVSDEWMRSKGIGVVGNCATEEARGTAASRWPIERIVDRGYMVATAYCGDLDPDYDDGYQDGIHPLFHSGGSVPADDEWGTIGAWAWGLSRALDYFEIDSDIDADRVAVMGHSRLGKTSLWAGAQDERFAIVISNNSGCCGAALSRRVFGETVGRINTSFSHWFCNNFREYNENEASCPVDQHMLIALAAPRPVYVASAVDDQWADPKGEYLGARFADPVYRLLGTDGLETENVPEVETSIQSTIGYHVRQGGHSVTNYDWDRYMDFADKHMK